MKIQTWVLTSLFLSSSYAWAQQVCLNLNGDWRGDCVYLSQQYGKLPGFIEFKFRQNSCSSLSIDGDLIRIPGKFEKEEKTQGGRNITRVELQWASTQKHSLDFQYEYHGYQGQQKKDEVKLSGQFSTRGSKLILLQEGYVDSDHVKISCELTK